MGQRHQIYLAIEDKEGGTRVLGLHHQWLFGQIALSLLNQFLTFVHKQTAEQHGYCQLVEDNCYANLDAHKEIFRALYSTLASEGYWHAVHDLDVELTNPLLGDNNDGITIIDLRGIKKRKHAQLTDARYEGLPRYCFMSLCGLEGRGKQPKVLTPLSAKQYVDHYYPLDATNLPAYVNDEFRAENDALVASLERFPLMTREQVKRLFPKMFEKTKDVS